ncbi:MAG: GNAT family N-acetyltransferase [Neomegalonema sp.]|nr:GNAT family N-acetyltransferase [Neomegalonema sp.]
MPQRSARPEIAEVDWSTHAEICCAIRRSVFVDEQQIEEEIEFDGLDPECRHFLALLDRRAVGVARMLRTSAATKIQRVAVLAPCRGAGVGARLMRAMIGAATAGPILLDAQTAAIAFYSKLGFVAEGGVFLDAGIPHRRMRMTKEGTGG